jgi:hypothetical protein
MKKTGLRFGLSAGRLGRLAKIASKVSPAASPLRSFYATAGLGRYRPGAVPKKADDPTRQAGRHYRGKSCQLPSSPHNLSEQDKQPINLSDRELKHRFSQGLGNEKANHSQGWGAKPRVLLERQDSRAAEV